MSEKKKIIHESYVNAGRQTDEIEVRISLRIIQLFSEGLYSSPNKAIEELVSNAFDAGAQNVQIILSPDLRGEEATIAIIDDGEGMNADGLKEHWVIGRSTRRTAKESLRRKPIGKFGIGKLATYVLASELTHICKKDGKYFAVTMDFGSLQIKGSEAARTAQEKGIFNEKSIKLPLRQLTKDEAKKILRPWISGKKPGYQALNLFGKKASNTWTVAIMSKLKRMGRSIQRGRLKWILRTAMPIRDDFKLYLDGDKVEPAKISNSLIQKWIIGKDIIQLPKPCPQDFEATEDESVPIVSVDRYGISQEELGRITGYVELYVDDISGGKSENINRSNGFFVYVRGRLINTDDPGFGIERNLLRHGTFLRLRAVVNIDALDDVLRSSREALEQGDLYNQAKDFLHAVFNLARNRLVDYERSQSPGALISDRIYSAPGSMTRRPLLALAKLAVENKATPLYMHFPRGLAVNERKEFLKQLEERAESDGLLKSIELSELDSKEGLAVYDIENSKLLINAAHPFVASFREFYTNARTSFPLEMLAMAEILMEAHLYFIGLEESKIRDILKRRDELLRQFVRSSARRTAGMIALALSDAKDDANKLEEEMRAAFEAIGFANVIRIGGKGKPDGTAEAYLAATLEGTIQRYKVGLEAKSGQIVDAHRLNVSGIARHMKEYACDHHIVIGNGFATSTGEDSASVKEITEHKKSTGKTITLMHIDDLSRLVRLIPAKQIGLTTLRKLFMTCITPEDSKTWVDGIAKEKSETRPHKEILETIWKLANDRPDEAIEYSAVATELMHRKPPVKISKKELIECCKAMQIMAGGVMFARDNTVEITRRPDLVLEDIRAAIGDYPEEERKTIKI
jgi:hypothetical protein